MISMRWRDGAVTWISPSEILIDGGEARARRVLSKPARDTESVREDGVITEVEVRLKPGDGQRFARAALRTLPEAVILLDDGDG